MYASLKCRLQFEEINQDSTLRTEQNILQHYCVIECRFSFIYDISYQPNMKSKKAHKKGQLYVAAILGNTPIEEVG